MNINNLTFRVSSELTIQVHIEKICEIFLKLQQHTIGIKKSIWPRKRGKRNIFIWQKL